MIFLSYFANDPAWISNCQTIRRDIFCYNTPCTNYTSLSYGNTTANNHIGCQPTIIFYRYWLRIFKIIKTSIFSFPKLPINQIILSIVVNTDRLTIFPLTVIMSLNFFMDFSLLYPFEIIIIFICAMFYVAFL